MNAIVPVTHAPPMTVSDVERVALAIAKGGLFGSKDPNAVLTLCLLAQAEGQHPAVVFRDYHIISGKPAKKAEAMLRDFLTAGGKIEWHKLDDDGADATFSHPQGGSARIAWDHERAKQAQLGGNAMYRKFPRQMFRSRVVSEGVRTVFPGATSGLYEANEVEAIVEERQTVEGQLAHHDEPHTEEQRPAPREKLEGPYSSTSKLKAAIKAFAETLRTYEDDLAGFTAWMQTEEVVELEKSALRYLPGWWETGEGCASDFEPMASRIARKQRELEELETLRNVRTPLDAG